MNVYTKRDIYHSRCPLTNCFFTSKADLVSQQETRSAPSILAGSSTSSMLQDAWFDRAGSIRIMSDSIMYQATFHATFYKLRSDAEDGHN